MIFAFPIRGVGSSDIVLAAVSHVTKVSVKTFSSRSRKWPAVEARMLSAVTLSALGLTDEKIALILGRSRTAVCRSRNCAAASLSYSRSFKNKFDKISDIISKSVQK